MQTTLFEIRDKREKDWFWVNNEFVDLYGQKIGSNAVAVYFVLCRHANNDTQQCFPSMETIGRKAGIKNRKTISKAIHVLKEYGVIEVEQAIGSDGKRLNNIYHLTNPRSWKTIEGFVAKVNFKVIKLEDVDLEKNDLFEVVANKASEKKAEEIDRKEFPWLDYDAWKEWVKYRKEKKNSLKPSTIKLQISFLSKNKEDHAEIIHTSIMNGWTGLFPLKKKIEKKEAVPQGKYSKI